MSVEIPLTQGFVALVDEEDRERVMAAGSWHAQRVAVVYARRTFYANGVRRDVALQNVLTGWERTDHINGNGLDNRRANLRRAVQQQNNLNTRIRRDNTSGFKGVRLDKRRGCWAAGIKRDGVYRYLGAHSTPEEAARAYDEAARELHGEFAALNFPRPGERSARTHPIVGQHLYRRDVPTTPTERHDAQRALDRAGADVDAVKVVRHG